MNLHSPFKFLDAYQKEDYDRFFGREKESAQLYNAVYASNLTLLYGASGTGKTSLVNCGLGNKFYETDWLPLFIRRGTNLLEATNTAIRQALRSTPSTDFNQRSIREKVRLLYLDHFRPIYLIFDQFEELFILGKEAEQQAFYQLIADLLGAGLQAKILIIIREEWIAWLNEFEKIVPQLFDNRLRIEPMNDGNVFQVIAGTAAYEGIQLPSPEKTVEKIIENLRGKRERVDLTNLQVYLDRLFRTYIQEHPQTQSVEDVIFDEKLVDEVGEMENVLSDFIDEQMELIENSLSQRKVNNVKGLPLEILFTLVTDDGTKQALDSAVILEKLPKNRQISKADLEFCLEEFNQIKLLRRLN